MRNAMKISKNTVLNCRVLLGLGRVTGSGAWISVMLSKPKISSNGSSVFRKNFDTVPYSDAKSLFSLLSWKSMGRVAGQAHEVNDVEGLSDSIKKPQLPLCLRQPLHYESLKSLLDWKIEACRHATAESSSWESLKDMPTQEDLETELAWLLDDSVAAIKLVPHGEWKQTSWRELERGMQFLNVEVAEVQLREPLGKLDYMWQRRIQERVPLQYVTSTAFWRDLILSVGTGVLIPRPETELMVDFALEAVTENPDISKGPWADLGTGSGALAIGLAKSIPEIPMVWAVDISSKALDYVAFNAQLAGQAERVRTCQGSWFDPLIPKLLGKLAGIVSNPPYIPSEQMQDLQAEVGLHEPWNALEGGQGLGVDALVPICTGAMDMLRPSGMLILETAGGEQAAYISQLLLHFRLNQFNEDGSEVEMLAFDNVRIRKDLRGVDRFVTAIKRKC